MTDHEKFKFFAQMGLEADRKRAMEQSIARWLEQFSASDRPQAEAVLASVEFYTSAQVPLFLHPQQLQYFSCFMSYSSVDFAFVQRLYAKLKANNIPCWFAPEDLKAGDRFREVIEQRLSQEDKVLLVLSANSISSRWVEREVLKALEREDKTAQDILVPIDIDGTVMTAEQSWAAEIRRARHIIDFRKHMTVNGYASAVRRLLRDLTK